MINSPWLPDVAGNGLDTYNYIIVLYDSLTLRISHIGSSISGNIATNASPH